MSAAKSSFTPGPWKVISTDEEAYDGAHVADMSNNLLVIADAEVGCPVADAHLIAAAPCLLAACKLIVSAFDALKPSNAARNEPLQINAARAAIAKATGETA